jgi:hypothetical protein
MAMADADKTSLACSLAGVPAGGADATLLSETYLPLAMGVVLRERNPFSDDPEGEEWEARYDHLQCEVAVDMFSRRGAEGERSHNENGISRAWETGGVSKSLLARIVPRAGIIR